MVVPKPPVALEHACSVIYDNALYAYQPGAFQRLALEEGAVWETLPMGESVDGGVCVGATPKDPANAGLFIVGGKAQTANYKGLQKFTYATGKWESVQPSAPVTQDRVWHGATYINSTDTILVYAGNQDGAQHPSSQTFTIQASAPYGVQAFESVAPPTIAPILLPWSETQAVLVGGDEMNTKVMLFSTSTSWTDSGASLAQGLAKNSSQVQAILVDGDDGCKNLYTFDMTITPNKVDRMVLLDSSGKPVVNSPIITTRDESAVEGRRQSARHRRDLTLPQWPAYNSTLAPNAVRTNYAVAQDPTGLVVFSGGNTNDVLCMFNGRKNSWVNASEKLAQQQIIAETASVTGLIASATTAVVSNTPRSSTASEATTSAAGNSQPINSNALLGIILGAIVAALLIIGLVLYIVRRRKRRQSYLEAGHMRRASGSPQDVKDVFAIANDSKLAGGLGHFRGHQPTESQGSHSSAAILLGRAGTKKDLRRKPSNESRRTSTSSIFNKHFKSTISKPIPQLAEHPALQPQSREEKGVSFAPDVTDPRPVQARPAQPRGQPIDRQNSTRRSSGWNRYWSGGSALNLLGFGNSQRTTVVSDRSSRYSENNNNLNRITQDSATVPAIHMANVVDGREKMKRVHSGSPIVSQYSSKNPLKEASSATIERPVSPESLSGYSSGIPASVHDTWDPLSSKKPWGSDRAPGNAYTGGGGFYPGLSVAANPAFPQNSRLDPPAGGSKQPQLAMASTSSDMSWLNLGDFGRRS